ncbi:FecR domain-containing protein [Terrimonas sp. NA20]|uniref:FecR domain-containing protein n=1 Tax=Terrimonas ginsenosidimutans TaxID=2908004 RepID=A0ABS9KW46_9BACT|nr:FecR domain-containing protein [Terrimonas ginsenosidimutans]MCG2616530.1 FecR domain-containing protein [Terrimonas ginsenosidimutans]
MDHSQEYIKNLIFEKLSSTIHPDDDQVLQSLISKPGPAQELWNEVNSFYKKEEAKKFLSSVDTKAEWKLVEERIGKPAKKAKVLRLLLPAAIAASVIAGVLLLRPMSSPTGQGQHLAGKSGKEESRIIFQVEGGEPIGLSDSVQQTIAAEGGTTLTTDGKSLRYDAGSNKWARIAVPAGKDYKIQLSDKSELWINSATTVRFPMNFSGDTREIELNGEAYLKVSADAAHPFIVRMPGADIEVLGTQFNLNSYDSGQVKVALVEGKVNLSSVAGKVDLKPGQQGMVTNGSSPAVSIFDKAEVLSWMDGQYNFYNAQVSEIGRILERCYGYTVVIKDKGVRQKRFTGMIDKNKSVTDFLNRLSSGMEVSYTFKDGVVEIN